MSNGNYRVTSIDVLRGLVMVIMALDHVRDYFHNIAFTQDPLDLQTTTIPLFFTRWITHFCAPIFVFLAGISAYLSGLKKTPKALSYFLITRGLWLILMEVTIVTFGWTFDPAFHAMICQVIWAIGISMVVLGLFVQLPYKIIVVIALLIVFGHNLLDMPEATHKGPFGFWWDLLHHGLFKYYPYAEGHGIILVYPVLPWIGVMTLGYVCGKLFEPAFDQVKRRRLLLYSGTGMILLFMLLRFINQYGDPLPWPPQDSILKSFLAFIRVNKYPPSLMFVCMTIGPALLFLALFETVKNKVSEWFSVFGRVPFFYYILHIYLIHILSVLLFFASGFGADDVASGSSPFLFRPAAFGVDLWLVYVIWIVVVGLLYFPCKWYMRYKATHNNWWLPYI